MQAGAAIGYSTSAQINPAPTPREIGLLDRASGINGSLDAVQSKLEALVARLAGQGNEKAAGATPQIGGLPNILSSAEDRLRRIHQLVDGLNDAF